VKQVKTRERGQNPTFSLFVSFRGWSCSGYANRRIRDIVGSSCLPTSKGICLEGVEGDRCTHQDNLRLHHVVTYTTSAGFLSFLFFLRANKCYYQLLTWL
jgi:hypothetical protein